MKTFDEAVEGYRTSRQYQALAFSTRRQRELSFTVLYKHLSGYLLREITRPMVLAIKDLYFEMPGKCHMLMSTLKVIFSWAYDQGWTKDNVCSTVGEMPASEPIRRWSEEEVELFLDTAPDYIRPVAMLALYTGQRRSDLTKLDWRDYDGETIHLVQQKTGKELWIPVHPRLREFLDSCPRKQWADRMPILTNMYGAPWTPEAMRSAVKRHCRRIGLGDKMLHGIRKTTASILAEIGCTPSQIMSITGHTSLKEVQRYTLEAEQKRMAKEAMGKWHS